MRLKTMKPRPKNGRAAARMETRLNWLVRKVML